MKGRIAAGGSALALAAGLISYYEGYVPRGYADPVGIPTACYGHTGPEVRVGQKYTKAQCDALLTNDIRIAQALVRRCIQAPMSAHQEAALVSFAFNVGAGRPGARDGICWLRNGKQPQIRIKANAGDWAGACAELSKWVSARGMKLPGLVKRRAAERALCEGRA